MSLFGILAYMFSISKENILISLLSSIFKPYTKHRAYIWNNNRYHGSHKDRKERQTFEYLGKIHL
jgi:hypothetical protein